jgi:DNA-binding MarR family transcriptional regulator
MPSGRASPRSRAPDTPKQPPVIPPVPTHRLDLGSPAESVADRVHSAAIHVLRSLRQEDEQMGLSGPRASALSVVVFAGPVTLGQLAVAEQVRPPTMTKLVAALERLGLVTRDGDPADARRVFIRATEKGRALLLKGRKRRIARLARELNALAPEDLVTLEQAAQLMERVAHAMRQA